MDMFVFLLLSAFAAASLGAGVFLVCNDYFEHARARHRAGHDHDEPGPRKASDLGSRARLFALGLALFSLLALPIDLGFAGTFTVILCGSFSFCLAPDLLGRGVWSH
jgi:hypothetical protein